MSTQIIESNGGKPKSVLRKTLRRPYLLFSRSLFDPITIATQLKGVPYFWQNWRAYTRSNTHRGFEPQVAEMWYRSYERFAEAGSFTQHYFHQDLWAARTLANAGVRYHVDVGSRIDGFIAHTLIFAQVCYVDLRPFSQEVAGLEFRRGSITDLPFPSNSIDSLSSLHVIEHIGLGRYGDPVDPDGHLRAAAELSRVLSPGGRLLLGTPVGRERLCFDAHRVFSPRTVLAMFPDLELADFALVNDEGVLISPATIEEASLCDYGCGLFTFRKPV
jgi:SAM-dependent methyltransferase